MLPGVLPGWSHRKRESNQTPGRASQTGRDVADGSRVTRFGISQHWAVGSNADGGNPVLHRFGHECRSIVESDAAGPTMQDDEVIQDINHVEGLDFAIDEGPPGT